MSKNESRHLLIASAVAVTMLAAGCSSGGSGGGSPRLKLEKTDIVVNAFPAIDSAGLYIAQDQGLFAAQGLHVTIVPVPKNGPPPSTQDLVNGQEKGKFDITAGDYVTYIEDQLGLGGAQKADLRIIAESSFLQPNVLTLLVKGGSPISQVSQLKGKDRLGQRAERHRHPASRFPARLARPHPAAGALQ
jgi:NitT/TauT family transport system substrate-binding protein